MSNASFTQHEHLVKKAKQTRLIKLLQKKGPANLLAAAFFIVILTGSVLLSLPFTNLQKPAPYLDNLFVSASAVCVTGLSTLTVRTQYNIWGKIIMILLMQVGGLGPMTIIAMFVTSYRRRMMTSEKKLFAAATGKSNIYQLSRYIRRIILFTLMFELIGFGLLSLRMIEDYGLEEGLFNALFLSVSAFTNAGFDPLGADSLIRYAADPLVSFTVMMLIIVGGLGFMVWFELHDNLWTRLREKYIFKRYWKLTSVHVKTVLVSTMWLLFTGTVLFYLCEVNNMRTIGTMDGARAILVSMFQSVTLRTAGFATVTIGYCTRPMLLIMCVFMLIGGSPGGTAGGMKTTTAVVLYKSAMNTIKNARNDAVIRKHIISPEMLKQAFMLLSLYLATVFTAILLLTAFEPRTDVLSLVFEAVSAIATVGISAGITASLSVPGKVIIILLMYIGRLGPLGIVQAFQKEKAIRNHVEYPKAHIIIG